MRYVALGAVAFVVAGFFDLAALKRIPYVKQAVGLTAVLLFGYSLVMVTLHPVKLEIPALLSYVGWPFLVVAVFLLIYSIFLEIPFRQTCAARGVRDRLVRTGTYTLVRHPGVLWLGLFLSALVLVSKSWLLLLATPVWLVMDVLYVWAQARFLLERMFPGYEQYRKETPALIPTPYSIVRCWRSGSRRRRSGTQFET